MFALDAKSAVLASATESLNSGAEVEAKYVVYWKNEDGRWKWHVDIWNFNA